MPRGLDDGRRRAVGHARGEDVHKKLGLVVRVRDIHIRAEGEQTERKTVQQRGTRVRGGEPFPRCSRILPQSCQVGVDFTAISYCPCHQQ